MSVTIYTALTSSQKDQILALDNGFPLDDADFFALYEQDETICSAAAFIQEDETAFECYAFTAPDFRRKGFFYEVLDFVIDELDEEVEFMFYTNGKEPATLAALETLEAELVLEEHMMEIHLSDWIISVPKCSGQTMPAPQKTIPSQPLTVHTADIDGTETLQYETASGKVNISVFSSYYYLYGFEIREELRGKGHGTVFLSQVMKDLASRNPLPLRLQVSGDNLPALALYKKTGFQITETLFGYLY